MSIVAGWYTDPVTQTGLRWWDGARWTAATVTPPAHVSASRVEPVRVMQAPPLAPASDVSPFAPVVPPVVRPTAAARPASRQAPRAATSAFAPESPYEPVVPTAAAPESTSFDDGMFVPALEDIAPAYVPPFGAPEERDIPVYAPPAPEPRATSDIPASIDPEYAAVYEAATRGARSLGLPEPDARPAPEPEPVAEAPVPEPTIVRGEQHVEDDRGGSTAARALVWGILSIPVFVAFPAALLAIGFGIAGLRRAGRLARLGFRPDGRGRAAVGLVLGILSLGAFAVLVAAYLLMPELVLGALAELPGGVAGLLASVGL